MTDLKWLTERPVAHRGFHDRDAGRIENSPTAIQAAVDRGFSIEVDLQIAADDVPMVFHDATLDRLTAETGPVCALPGNLLSRLPLCGSGDTIPTFDDLLTIVDGKVPLVVELKPHGRRTDALADAVLQRLESYSGKVALMSFDPEMVATIAAKAPNQVRGIIADATPRRVAWGGGSVVGRFGLRHLLHVPRTRPHFIAYDCQALPAPAPAILHRLCGRPVLTWTVRDRAEQNRVRRWTDQIIFEGFDPN